VERRPKIPSDLGLSFLPLTELARHCPFKLGVKGNGKLKIFKYLEASETDQILSVSYQRKLPIRIGKFNILILVIVFIVIGYDRNVCIHPLHFGLMIFPNVFMDWSALDGQ